MPAPDPRVEADDHLGRDALGLRPRGRPDLGVALVTEAQGRFGPERAEALAPDLQALAADLARVAEASLPPEVEPAFFLLGE